MVTCVHDIDQAKLLLGNLSRRISRDSQKTAMATVEKILNQVREDGDKALISLTEQLDGFCPSPLQISSDDLKEAWEQTPKELQCALTLAKERIEDFHQRQKPKDLLYMGNHGETLGRKWNPIEKAGIYVPGGRASYPSTVLMNAIPAKVAGVKNITMVSPANKNGKINSTVLAAAHLTGINQIFRIGGAQAIAALAFGTEEVQKVDVITGPGNLYVTLAKKAVYGEVGIDSLAGPSEVLVIADHTATAKQVAADMLAQAEHDPLAASVLITTQKKLEHEVIKEFQAQLEHHPRRKICEASLEKWGLIVTCENLDDCIQLSNLFAPEHLELLVEHPEEISEKIDNAGAIFLGPWSPEAAGDYLAGPNHTLPTCGSARFCSALSVETFMKNTSLIKFNEMALNKTGEAIVHLAKSEGLHSHAESVNMRIKK